MWTAVLFDADNQGYPYLKRFLMEATQRKQNFMGENPSSKLVLLSDQVYPLIRVTYGGADEYRGSEDIDAEQFIAVKGFKAKGKRISTWQIESIEELEPIREAPEAPLSSPEGDTIDSASETIEAPSGAVGGAPSSGAVGGAPSSGAAGGAPSSGAVGGAAPSPHIDEMTGQLSLFSDDEF